MTSKKTKPVRKKSSKKKLRSRAEDMLKANRTEISNLSEEEVQTLVNDLQVHQMELKIQNEELQQAQMELAESLDRYTDLYEFSPVGYMSLDNKGKILAANLTVTKLLGVPRNKLLGSNLTTLVASNDQDELYRHIQSVISSEGTQTCEISTHCADGNPIAIRFESLACRGKDSHEKGGESLCCRSALIDISKEVEAEEWMIQAKRLKKMVEHLPAGAVFVENSHLVMNRAAEVITGYKKDELTSRESWFHTLYGKTWETAFARYAKHRRAGFPDNFEETIIRCDGEERRIEFAAHGFDDHEVWFLNDFTEAEASRERLIESERRHRAILNAVNDAVVTIDKRGEIVGVNPAVKKLFGYREKDIIGKNVRMLMPSPDRKQHDQYLDNYHRTGKAKIIGIGREVIACRKDGSHFPVELSISKVEGLGLFTGVIRDISARKSANEALHYELEFRNAIISSAETVILILNPDGDIIRFNPYFERISGWLSKDAEGLDWFQNFIPKKDWERLDKIYHKMFADESYPKSLTFSVLTKIGKERQIEWSFAPLPEVDGQITGLLCTGIDVTDKLGLELQVINVAEEERRRTASELHDGVGSLLTGIDYRIQALVKELSQIDMLGADEARLISKQIREAITQVRAISSGLHPVGAHPEDLKSALKDLTSKTFRVKGLTYRFRCDSSIRVNDVAQANHLYRIAQEAVNNSIKHSGCSHITTSLEQKKDMLILKILDNGRGYRNETARVGGLGLHNMDYRARAMNGSLHIRRRKEGGTEVLCAVPIK